MALLQQNLQKIKKWTIAIERGGSEVEDNLIPLAQDSISDLRLARANSLSVTNGYFFSTKIASMLYSPALWNCIAQSGLDPPHFLVSLLQAVCNPSDFYWILAHIYFWKGCLHTSHILCLQLAICPLQGLGWLINQEISCLQPLQKSKKKLPENGSRSRTGPWTCLCITRWIFSASRTKLLAEVLQAVIAPQ